MLKIRTLVLITFALISCTFAKSRIYIVKEEGIVERPFDNTIVSIRDFPYEAFLKNVNGDYCGGIILGPRHVLTSGYCLDKIFGKYKNPADFYVTTGTTDSRINGTSYRILSLVYHPKYNPMIGLNNDLAIISLLDEIEFDITKKPINLPIEKAESGSIATYCGWRIIKFTEKKSVTVLDAIKMRILPRKPCEIAWNNMETHNSSHALFGKRQVCVERQFKTRSYVSDPGGVLVIGDFLIGIASLRDNYSKRILPVIFTDIVLYLPWINGIIKG